MLVIADKYVSQMAVLEVKHLVRFQFIWSSSWFRHKLLAVNKRIKNLKYIILS